MRRREITPARAKIGGSVTISFDAREQRVLRRQRVMADLVVHFVKARGTRREDLQAEGGGPAARAAA